MKQRESEDDITLMILAGASSSVSALCMSKEALHVDQYAVFPAGRAPREVSDLKIGWTYCT